LVLKTKLFVFEGSSLNPKAMQELPFSHDAFFTTVAIWRNALPCYCSRQWITTGTYSNPWSFIFFNKMKADEDRVQQIIVDLPNEIRPSDAASSVDTLVEEG